LLLPKQFIGTSTAPKPVGPYSQAIKVGPFVFVAGQGSREPATGKIARGIEAQTRQAILNVKAIVEASGLSLSDVVKVSVFLKKASDFQKMNAVYKTFFKDNPPTRTTVEVKLVEPGMLVEIDAIAYRE
jgi:2-iminobutanoate/2-iminopropanoate deaminase